MPALRTSSYRLQGVESAPRAARMAVDAMRGELAPGVHHRLRVLASELVSAAVLGGGATSDPVIGLSVERDDGLVRIEVSRLPGGAGRSLRRFAPSPQWTLAMLDALADEWGVVHDECGRPVTSWAELRTGPE